MLLLVVLLGLWLLLELPQELHLLLAELWLLVLMLVLLVLLVRDGLGLVRPHGLQTGHVWVVCPAWLAVCWRGSSKPAQLQQHCCQSRGSLSVERTGEGGVAEHIMPLWGLQQTRAEA